MLKLWWGRNPAYWAQGLAQVVTLLVAFGLPLTAGQVGGLDAFFVAVAAVITAVAVKSDKLVPIMVGAIQAGLALAVGFGVAWSDSQVALVVGVISMILTGLLVRPEVTAPVDITGTTVVGPAKSLSQPKT